MLIFCRFIGIEFASFLKDNIHFCLCHPRQFVRLLQQIPPPFTEFLCTLRFSLTTPRHNEAVIY